MGRLWAQAWRRDLGPGTSGVVTDGKTVFTMYSVPVKKGAGQGDELIVALDAATGNPRWENRYPVARLKGQESYSGDPIQPQATPCLAGSLLCTLGYTGILTVFDVGSGRILWRRDLVKEDGATPVQFGFAASPVSLGENFLVHVGGAGGAVVAFAKRDGKPRWKTEAGEPSYATPVLARFAGEEQVVQVTRDAVFGFSAKDGATRWRYPMPEAGLTNVPTPIALPGDRLLVSGQGTKGTRLLRVTRKGNAFDVAEVWKNERVRFFYCNWLADANAVYGCTDSFFHALNLNDGTELWRERGQNEGNLVRYGRETLVLRGDGLLTRCEPSATRLVAGESAPAIQGRCWAAPTLSGDRLFVRSDAEIVSVRLK